MPRLSYGNLELDSDTQVLSAPRGSVKLSQNDYLVMSALMRREQRLTTTGSLIAEVWASPRNEPKYSEHAIRCCIKNPRGFIGLAGLGRHAIRRERGYEYYLEDRRPRVFPMTDAEMEMA